MIYSDVHKKILFEADPKKLQEIADRLKWAMKQARQMAKQPMGKRKGDGPFTTLDHLEKSIIEAARAMGIEFGVEWGSDLDLSSDS